MIQHNGLCQKERFWLESHSHTMTAEGTRDTGVLHQGRLTVDPLDAWLVGGVELTGVLNAIPQVGRARLFTVY